MQPASNLTKEYPKQPSSATAAFAQASKYSFIYKRGFNLGLSLELTVLQVRDQLNFYLGDSNLAKDKFLRQKLSESSQLPLSLFLTFNRVKSLLKSEGEIKKQSVLEEAIKKSNMLKLSKCGKLVKRRIAFSAKTIDTAKMDDCTVYVENFPESLTLSDIAKIFSRAGEIRNITLPKFGDNQQDVDDSAAMDTDESQSRSKGYCFVEYAVTEAANVAVETFNNCVPEELTNAGHINYVGAGGNLSQLNVMKKETWKTFKDEARQIREEIARLNSSTMFASGSSFDGFVKGTLIRLHHSLNTTLISKNTLREALSHFGSVAFVDL